MSTDDQISALERLTKLRDSGALTEEEFQAQKTALLSKPASSAPSIPFYRRLWLVVTLTCLLVTFWVSLIILATGEVYKQAKDGSLVPIKRTTRLVYSGLLTVWIVALVLKAVIDPEGARQDWSGGLSQVGQKQVASQPVAKGLSAAPPQPGQTASMSAPPAAAPSPPPPEQTGPDMRAMATRTDYGQLLTVVADDDSAFTIKRVVFNGREKEPGCDYPDFKPDENSMAAMYGGTTPLPVTLKRGETAAFLSGCGAILSVDIHTDRGTAQLKLQN